jgi:hypothetical protein
VEEAKHDGGDVVEGFVGLCSGAVVVVEMNGVDVYF